MLGITDNPKTSDVYHGRTTSSQTNKQIFSYYMADNKLTGG